MSKWSCVLEQNSQRQRVADSESALRDAIDDSADLRVGTEFLHDEEIDTLSDWETSENVVRRRRHVFEHQAAVEYDLYIGR